MSPKMCVLSQTLYLTLTTPLKENDTSKIKTQKLKVSPNNWSFMSAEFFKGTITMSQLNEEMSDNQRVLKVTTAKSVTKKGKLKEF